MNSNQLSILNALEINNKAGLESSLLYRLSKLSKGKLAPKGCKWLEVFKGKDLIKAIPVPLEITEEQMLTLVSYIKKEIGL